MAYNILSTLISLSNNPYKVSTNTDVLDKWLFGRFRCISRSRQRIASFLFFFFSTFLFFLFFHFFFFSLSSYFVSFVTILFLTTTSQSFSFFLLYPHLLLLLISRWKAMAGAEMLTFAVCISAAFLRQEISLKQYLADYSEDYITWWAIAY